MRVNITPDCETFRVSPMDRSRRDIGKIAQHFSGGWVSERRDRPARDDRIVFCLPTGTNKTGAPNPSAAQEGSIVPIGTEPSFIVFIPSPERFRGWATFVVSLRDQSVRGLSPERGRKCYVHAHPAAAGTLPFSPSPSPIEPSWGFIPRFHPMKPSDIQLATQMPWHVHYQDPIPSL